MAIEGLTIIGESINDSVPSTKRLCIDTPDPEIAKAGLEAYDQDRAGGRPPILNSISQLRLGMFDLAAIGPFTPIFLATEREEGGQSQPCHTAEQTYGAARLLVETARRRIA